jgi:hypothetical protein
MRNITSAEQIHIRTFAHSILKTLKLYQIYFALRSQMILNESLGLRIPLRSRVRHSP